MVNKLKTFTRWSDNSNNPVNQIANEYMNNILWNPSPNGSKHINLTLKNAVGQLVVNTRVKYAVFEYRGGEPSNFGWMTLMQDGYLTTDINGVFDILYLGTELIGSSAYVAIFNGSESMIYPVIITFN